MIEHVVRGLHERNDDKPVPEAFVADVVCACTVLFASGVHPDPESARAEALELWAGHVSAMETSGD